MLICNENSIKNIFKGWVVKFDTLRSNMRVMETSRLDKFATGQFLIMGIPYEGSILLGVYCTKGSNWMHRSRRLSASNLAPVCNKHLTILYLNIVFPLLHGITKKIVTEKKVNFCHVIVGDNIIYFIFFDNQDEL